LLLWTNKIEAPVNKNETLVRINALRKDDDDNEVNRTTCMYV
jgi:hypothetical protein